MPKQEPKNKAKELVSELKELYLRTDSEIMGRGLYYRVLAEIPLKVGHVDKDTALLVRIRDIILELEKELFTGR